jgi:ABC-2 type transport system permease protein
MFALQELIGADKVNGALRAYYARFVDMKPPFPTTLDLVHELRVVAGPEYQRFITDYFEKIMLYDAGISSASVKRVDAGYEITMEIDAHQFEADGVGNETEVPLDTWFQVAVFPHSDKPLVEQQPLYLQQHRLHGGVQRVTVVVAEPPATVVVDPFRLMIDRVRENNEQAL